MRRSPILAALAAVFAAVAALAGPAAAQDTRVNVGSPTTA